MLSFLSSPSQRSTLPSTKDRRWALTPRLADCRHLSRPFTIRRLVPLRHRNSVNVLRVASRPPRGALTSPFGETADVSASSASGGGAVTHPNRAPRPLSGARERAPRWFLSLARRLRWGSGEVKAAEGTRRAGGAAVPVPARPVGGPPGGRGPGRRVERGRLPTQRLKGLRVQARPRVRPAPE